MKKTYCSNYIEIVMDIFTFICDNRRMVIVDG